MVGPSSHVQWIIYPAFQLPNQPLPHPAVIPRRMLHAPVRPGDFVQVGASGLPCAPRLPTILSRSPTRCAQLLSAYHHQYLEAAPGQPVGLKQGPTDPAFRSWAPGGVLQDLDGTVFQVRAACVPPFSSITRHVPRAGGVWRAWREHVQYGRPHQAAPGLSDPHRGARAAAGAVRVASTDAPSEPAQTDVQVLTCTSGALSLVDHRAVGFMTVQRTLSSWVRHYKLPMDWHRHEGVVR
jgi:hypothetical protein